MEENNKGVIDLMAPKPKDWEPIRHLDMVIHADGTTNLRDVNEEILRKRAEKNKDKQQQDMRPTINLNDLADAEAKITHLDTVIYEDGTASLKALNKKKPQEPATE